MDKEKIKSIIEIVFIVALFILCSYIVQVNLDFIKQYLDFGIVGMILFVVILALSVIIAPISSVPLFPLASGLWGVFIAGALGTIGWTIGAVVAFFLARKYGVSLVKRFVPMKNIYHFQDKVPEKNVFWTVVLIRVVSPIDISYLMGLFSKMRLSHFALATFIGLIPFTFMTAYIGTASSFYQLIFMIIALSAFALVIIVLYLENKGKRSKISDKKVK